MPSFTFTGIIKTKIAPHNRTLRTSFVQKLKDAFFVFFGAACKEKLGILDILLLGIPLMLFKAASWCSKHIKNPWVRCGLYWLLFVLYHLFFVLKLLTTAFFVFNPVSLMVIAAVQLIAKYVVGGKELEEQALSLLLTDENGQKINLEKKLLAPKSGVDPQWEKTDFSLEVFRINFEGPRLVIEEVLEHKTKRNNRQYYASSFCYLPVFEGGNVVKHKENITALKALIKLNIGNVSANLETTPEGTKLLKNIMAAPAA